MRSILFIFFFFSGFCSLLYQVVWLRLAFAAFGVTTPVVSVVISIFMVGLALGSYAAGEFATRGRAGAARSLRCYGLAECIIGIGAFVVPNLFQFGEQHLLQLGAMGSARYLAFSALFIAASLLPWCFCMGTTFPLVMDYIKRTKVIEEQSFSYLYLGNVLGATVGTISTAMFFVEFLGFTSSLRVAAAFNFAIALTSWWLSRKAGSQVEAAQKAELPVSEAVGTAGIGWGARILFITGFCSMAMEVVWTRAFTPITRTTIYAFALLLATYLISTAVGSFWYRRHLKCGKPWKVDQILFCLAIAAFLPLLCNDPRLHPRVGTVVGSLVLLCAGLGYLTPQLIDVLSKGAAGLAGRLYAINILGCILGPLAAGYVLLPYLGAKWSLILLAVPFAALALEHRPSVRRVAVMGGAVAVALFATTYEDPAFYKGNAVVRRDHTATIVAHGTGMRKQLAVNGVAITFLTPITKVMAHFPLAILPPGNKDVLVICFGMGTTYRAAMSWGDTRVTAAELVPSVKESFGYFHADADVVLKNSRGTVVVDDGRRFLKRTGQKFDLITLDPPPPVEAAGSSMLYSKEFYDAVKLRLKPNGILQQWFPGGEDRIFFGVAKALHDSFPHVKMYHSIENWGYHFLASEAEFEVPDAGTLLARMPEDARKDLMEWYRGKDPEVILKEVLARETPLDHFGDLSTKVAISDDRPVNEYFYVHRLWARFNGQRRNIE